MARSPHALAVLCVIAAAASACVDYYPPGPATIDLPDCVPPSGNGAWSSAQITVTRITPEKCPCTVVSGLNHYPYAFSTHAPLGSLGFNTLAWLNIVDWQGYNRAYVTRYWVINPNKPSEWLAMWDVSAQPGQPRPNSGGVLEDTVRFASFSSYGTAEGALVLKGGESITAGSLQGPSSIVAGATEWYHAHTRFDTAAYYYSWTVNGSLVTGATDASESMSFANVGSYTIKALAKRADETIDTLSKTIAVTIGVNFTGQSVIEPWTHYEWTVSPVGGTGPYAFEWWMDANFLRTGTSYSNAFNPNETHWFDVKITDALNNVGWTSFSFSVSNDGGGENQLRIISKKLPPPASPGSRRRPPGYPQR